MLTKPKRISDIGKLEFNQATFWNQIHNIPIICMNKDIGLFLAKRVGVVKDLDMRDAGDYLGRFIRARVDVDITKPLERVLT